MTCINPNCREELEDGAPFCPFCATAQAVSDERAPAYTNAADPLPGQAFGGVATTAPLVAAAPASPFAAQPQTNGAAVLEMRDQSEPERAVQPGERRPLVVLDEQTVHLSHTDQHLAPEQLLRRVTSIIDAQQVPVEVQMVKARWMRDSREVRPRIIASLREHLYSDIKMTLGVDYMGRWASIQLHLGVEPEPVPVEPEAPKWEKPMDALIALIGGLSLLFLGAWANSNFIVVLGVLGFIYGAVRGGISYSEYVQRVTAERAKWVAAKGGSGVSGSPIKLSPPWRPPVDGVVAVVVGVVLLIFLIGIIPLGYGIARLYVSYKTYIARRALEKSKQVAEGMYKQFKKEEERLSRTFKVDDMRLFCTAMRSVFQAVVDDVVRQGGEVVRVEGGKGGFFETDGAEQNAPTPRHSDAAASEV